MVAVTAVDELVDLLAALVSAVVERVPRNPGDDVDVITLRARQLLGQDLPEFVAVYEFIDRTPELHDPLLVDAGGQRIGREQNGWWANSWAAMFLVYYFTQAGPEAFDNAAFQSVAGDFRAFIDAPTVLRISTSPLDNLVLADAE